MKKVVVLCTMFFMVMFLFISTSLAGKVEDELAQIQATIKAKGASWTAGITKISKLPEAIQNRLLGLRSFSRRGGSPALRPLKAAPTTLDWRSKGKVTSVKDQGQCGSCWAFAAVSVLESSILMKGGPNLDLSEQFMVSCDTSNAGCNGGYLDRAANFLKSTGTVDEACFKYAAQDVSCEKKCSAWSSKIKKISAWGWVDSNPENIKKSLETYGPLYAGYTVYKDFMYYKKGIYQHIWGGEQGGHAVVIVGYDSNQRYWIVKNSWGKDWGENGYFRIRWNTVDMEKQVIWMSAQ